MDFTISFESIDEGETSANCDTLDLTQKNHLLGIVVGFGNGIFEEVRVVGKTKEAALYFLRIVQGGGVDLIPTFSAPPSSRLHRDGDAYFSIESVGISISPITETGETIDFTALESEFARIAASLETESERSPPSVQKPEQETIPQDVKSLPPSRSHDPWWKFW